MHKLIILTSTILFLMFPVSGAKATSIGLLVEYCKPLANRGFELKAQEDIYCLSALKSINEAYYANCRWLKAAKSAGMVMPTKLLQFIASGDAPPNALIQSFVNWAEANPAKWQDTPSSYQFEWQSTQWPCDY